MTTPSNLYATKCYAEHPIGLWPIDDELTFLSLVPQANRNLLTWLGSIEEYDFADGLVADPPFNKEKTYTVSNPTTVVEDDKTYYMTQIASPNLFNFYTGLNHEQKVFSVNAYVYHRMPVAFYEVGYLYNNGSQDVLFTERILPGPPNEWIRLGRTFDQSFISLNARIYIRAYFSQNTDTRFLVNGVSVGQWSETTSNTSLGVYKAKLHQRTGLPNIFDQDLYGVELREYGPGTDTGYALVQDNRLLAVNGGVPLVYGSNSVTTLIPSNDTGIKLPSIVVPGKGLLNSNGRFNKLTLEAWVRIDNREGSDRRIIGPVSSTDGIYVRGNSISMVIGQEYRSYYVGEWYRPMLLHWTVRDGEASVMLNGERIMTMPYNASTAKLPDNRLRDEDWIGFYSWDNIHVFEIDTISIYPYAVPSAVAKRRFVWGQGVESPETINSAYLGTAHTVDFAYAKYHANASYPQTARWDSGQSDNLMVSSQGIRPMDYTLPELISTKRTPQEIFDYSKSAWLTQGGPSFVSFTAQRQQPTYLFFSDANKVVGEERMFYGVFSGTSETGAPLFIFEHKISGVQLRADIMGNVITYSYNGNEFERAYIAPGAIYAVGLDFSKLPPEATDFMSNSSMVELYVAGDKTVTFTGKIYRIGFCTPERGLSIAEHFGGNGVVHPMADLVDFVASYTLKPISAFGRYYLDIATYGEWSEVYPLSYFADDGHIDLMQYNIAAPIEQVQTTLTFFDLSDRIIPVYDSIVEPDVSGVLDLRSRPTMLSADFLAKDNTVIMAPEDVSDLAVRIKLSVEIDGINTSAFKLSSMSLASVANTTDLFFQMGTMHSYDVAPYTKVGNYYSNKVERPWTTYKASTPYLYLTNSSGLHPLSEHGYGNESGLWITMNGQKDIDFKVSSMQVWVKYSETSVPEEPIELFSVRSDNIWIKFMGVDDGTGLRAKVFAVDGWTGEDHTQVRFHQDGDDVVLPFIQNQHWTSIGIDFEPLIDLRGDIGAICLLSSCVFNNIVFYRTMSLHEQYKFAYRTWEAVRNSGTTDLTWEYWRTGFDGGNATWDQVAKTATISHGISVDEIYKTYVGTNRHVVDDTETMLVLDSGTSTAISNDIVEVGGPVTGTIRLTHAPEWTTIVRKPV